MLKFLGKLRFCLKSLIFLNFKAVESESAHHNISAADLHHKTAEAGHQDAKSLENAFETESDASGM